MDLQYGIAVTNKYALFIDEDEDPLEILRQKEEEAKNQKKDPSDKKTKSKQSKKTAVATETKPKPVEQPIIKKEGMYIIKRIKCCISCIRNIYFNPHSYIIKSRAPFWTMWPQLT